MTIKGLATHDELVSTTGINAWFLKDVPQDGEEALKLEKENGEAEGMEFVTIGNGDSFVLEL